MSSLQQENTTSQQDDAMDIDNEDQPQNPQDIIELIETDSEDEDDRKLPSRVRDHNHVASNSPDNISQRRRRRRIGSITASSLSSSSNNSGNTNQNNLPSAGAIIDLVDSPARVPSAAAASASNTGTSNDDDDDDGGNDTWACPQCTLLNPTSRQFCEACRFRNPNHVRAPDASFRDQLIPDHQNGFSYSQTRYGNPLLSGSNTTSNTTANPQGAAMFLSGGALLGGVMGAAGSLMNGRPVLSSAAEGAMTGAVSGAIIHEVLNQQDEMAAARSSAAMGLAGYPSMNPSQLQNSYDDDNEIAPQPRSSRRRARPRASYRVFEERDPMTGATTTVVQAGSSTTRFSRPTTRSSSNRGAKGLHRGERGRHRSGRCHRQLLPDNFRLAGGTGSVSL